MGSAADSGKFDVAHIARNTVMQFTLTWMGAESDTDGPAQIEQMLGALHTGEIRLGAQKSNGFGRVSLTVRSQTYHMTDKADRDAWLHDKFDGQTLELPEICTENVCTFTVNGVADSILIKSSVPRVEYDENNTRKEIIQNIKENGTAVCRVRRSRVLCVPVCRRSPTCSTARKPWTNCSDAVLHKVITVSPVECGSPMWCWIRQKADSLAYPHQ